MISDRIALLRQEMKKEKIDIYVIPTADFHQSEYVGDHFKCREYMTGFTGSAGTVVFTQKEAYLWTDGRYFIQAAKQLAGTEIRLQKSGEPGVPTIAEFLETAVADVQAVIGFDGRTVSIAEGKHLSLIHI